MGSSMIRCFLLAAALVVVAGCNSEGSAEANGDTKSLSKEIPPPKPQEKVFTPQGHSILKEGPPGGGTAPGAGTTPATGDETPGAGGPSKEVKSPKKGG